MLTALCILFLLPALALAAMLLFRMPMPCASGDWLPSTDVDLDDFAVNWATLVTAAPGTYGLVAGDAVTATALSSAFSASLTAATDPSTRTEVTIAQKDADRTALKFELRAQAKRVQADAAVLNADRTALGLTVRDTDPTVIPAPGTFPLLSFIGATPLAHDLRFADSLTPDSKAKPANAVGMELYVKPSATAIADPTELTYHSLVTRNPIALQYDSGDAGKIAYAAARWVNAKGERGPWSSISSMGIAA